MNEILIEKTSNDWPEAEVVAAPVNRSGIGDYRILVRRRRPAIWGSDGNEYHSLPGYPAISLFTGAGGFDIGLERAGFCSVVQHEWDIACCQTLIANRPRFFRCSALIQGDITKTPTEVILREGGLRVGEAYLVVGGPPCQGFSTLNKNAVANRYDKRNDLVFEYVRVIDQAKPHFFTMENIPNFMQFNGGEYLKAFLESAYAAYYELVYGLVNCVEYGVPQSRIRFICMGTRRDIFACDGNLAGLPSPRCFGKNDLNELRVIEKLPLFGQERELLMQAPGIRYFPNREILRPPSPVTGVDFEARTKTFIDFYRRLKKEEPDRLVFGPRSNE